MYYVKRTVVNRFLVNGGEVWQETLLYSPGVRSKSFTDLPLNCELHKCFPFFFPQVFFFSLFRLEPVARTVGVGSFPSPRSVRL